MKPELDKIRKIYFLGLGGIGMSALARYFLARGVEIHGYDKTSTALTGELQAEGMFLHFNDDPALIPQDIDLIIFTPAIPKTLEEYRFLELSGKPMMKRAEVTGIITENRKTVAIAGTHGKTSISSLVAHILRQAGHPVTALIGGISKNYRSNYISSGKDDIMVVEADEYDRSFLSLHPDVAVISSMDPDHLDIYGTADEVMNSFHEFALNIKAGGFLVIRSGLSLTPKPGITRINYCADQQSEAYASNLRIMEGFEIFDLHINGLLLPAVKLQIPGKHNVENAVAAATVCKTLGVGSEQIREGIETFTGVKRRFDTRLRQPGLVYIDDYAHHPGELEAFISAVRQLYPGRKLTGLFQPHLYTRTRDFAPGFAKSLDLLDEAWLLDIYPARETAIPGVTSNIIMDLMLNHNRKLVSMAEVLELLRIRKPEIFLTMGAGDIDLLVEPVTNILSK